MFEGQQISPQVNTRTTCREHIQGCGRQVLPRALYTQTLHRKHAIAKSVRNGKKTRDSSLRKGSAHSTYFLLCRLKTNEKSMKYVCNRHVAQMLGRGKSQVSLGIV